MMRGQPSVQDRPSRVALQIKRWLLGALGLGFGGLAVDAFLEHFLTLHAAAQWIPIAFGPPAGVIALVAAWRFEALTLRLFSVASWLSIVIGALGVYYHSLAVARGLQSLEHLFDWQKILALLRYSPPLGAPVAFVGIGVVGLLVHTCALRLEHVLVPKPVRQAEFAARPLTAYVLFALGFLVLVLAPLSPVLIHRLF